MRSTRPPRPASARTRLPAARVCRPSTSSGAVMHVSIAGEASRQVAVDKHHDVVLGHHLLDGIHERALVQARRVVVVLHQSRHQRQVVGRPLAAGVAERQDRHVELAAAQRVVLLVRPEERFGWKYLDVEVDVGCRDLVGDDLGDLVADVAGRPLVREPEIGSACGACRGDGRPGQKHGSHLVLPEHSPALGDGGLPQPSEDRIPCQ